MKNGNNTTLKPHKLSPETIKSTIHVDFGDYSVLKVYKKVLKAPMRAVMHHFIGIAVRCLEEKHDQQIQYLQERVSTQAFIIVKYIEKYGQLRVKD